jgi:hypothetical protein
MSPNSFPASAVCTRSAGKGPISFLRPLFVPTVLIHAQIDIHIHYFRLPPLHEPKFVSCIRCLRPPYTDKQLGCLTDHLRYEIIPAKHTALFPKHKAFLPLYCKKCSGFLVSGQKQALHQQINCMKCGTCLQKVLWHDHQLHKMQAFGLGSWCAHKNADFLQPEMIFMVRSPWIPVIYTIRFTSRPKCSISSSTSSPGSSQG